MIEGTDSGHDSFTGGEGYDTILGSAGDDTIRMYRFGPGNSVESIDGGAGVNVVAGTGAGDILDLSATNLSNIAHIDTGAGNDTVIGSAGNDVIIGGAGSDTLDGGAGDDTFLIEGTDSGHDSFTGGEGYDTILGGEGDDTIRVYRFGPGNSVESIDGGAGINVLAGTGAGDILDLSATTISNIAHIDTGAGNDTVIGSAGNDVIIGGAGSDNLSGGDGNDLVAGSSGNDRIAGSGGADIMSGGFGNDVLTVADANDVVLFNAGDGSDIVNIGTDASFALSLGGGIRLSGLHLSRTGNDLCLESLDPMTGASADSIVLKDWYGDATVGAPQVTLQLIMEASSEFDAGSSNALYTNKILQLDFDKLANDFNAAGIDHWSVMESALDSHLSSSDSEALGGDVAYQYGLTGGIDGLSPNTIATTLSDPDLGERPQTITIA